MGSLSPTGFTHRTWLGVSSLLLFTQRCWEISVGGKRCKHYVTFAGSCPGCGNESTHAWPHTVAEQRLTGESRDNQWRKAECRARKTDNSGLGTHTWMRNPWKPPSKVNSQTQNQNAEPKAQVMRKHIRVSVVCGHVRILERNAYLCTLPYVCMCVVIPGRTV